MAILTPSERKRMGTLVVWDLLISLADIASLAWLLLIIKIYTGPAGEPVSGFLPGWLQDRQSLVPITLFLLLFSAKNLAGFLVYREQCRFVARVATRIARERLQQYLEGAYTNFINVDSSVHIRRISYQPIDFCQHVLAGIQQVITQSVLIVLTIVAILLFNAQLFILLFLLLLPPVIGVFYLVKKRLRKVRSETRSSSEKALQHLQEALNGFVESNIYNKNAAFLERYMDRQQQFNHHFAQTLITQGIPARMMEVFALLGLFILVALYQWSGNAGSDAIITIGAFMAAAYKIIPGIVKILNTAGQIQTYFYTTEELIQGKPDKARSAVGATAPHKGRNASTAAHSTAHANGIGAVAVQIGAPTADNGTLGTNPDSSPNGNGVLTAHAGDYTNTHGIPSAHEAIHTTGSSHIVPPVTHSTLSAQEATKTNNNSTHTASTNSTTSALPAIHALQFNQVHFRFGEKPVLRNLTWSLQPGDFMGISGPSGQGKTTILNLLLGFLEPDAGNISINGEAADTDQRKRYWPVIAYVKQQPFLLHDTLLHNITLNGNHYHEKKFQRAVQTAGLLHFLPRQHDQTLIAEQGRNISGGQRQRIAIARALYKDADLIILDEPFNELDHASEQTLLQHFKQLTEQGKMVILITHHKESFSFCNKILQLDV